MQEISLIIQPQTCVCGTPERARHLSLLSIWTTSSTCGLTQRWCVYGAVGHPLAKISHKDPISVCKHSAIDFTRPPPTPYPLPPPHPHPLSSGYPAALDLGQRLLLTHLKLHNLVIFPQLLPDQCAAKDSWWRGLCCCFTGCVSWTKYTRRGGFFPPILKANTMVSLSYVDYVVLHRQNYRSMEQRHTCSEGFRCNFSS